jgi:hypothetical protein
MNGVDSTRPTSKIDTMFGWFRSEAVRASFSRRARRSGSPDRASGSNLIATSRPRRVSRAR